MRGSAKGDEPKALTSWKKDQWAALVKPRYGDLSGDPQHATKKALFAEQTGQCVYCGRAIDLEERNRYHIEHFRPRSLYPGDQLVYENLFLSCGPQQSQGGLNQHAATGKRIGLTRIAMSSLPPRNAVSGGLCLPLMGRFRATGHLRLPK